MIGEWLKIILLFLILSAFVFLISSEVLAQATGPQVEPPGIETGKNIIAKTTSSTKAFFSKIGEGFNDFFLGLMPFLKNSDEKITNWWNKKAKPWVLEAWEKINIYLDEEIIIR